jgi:hypothetical protein
MLLVVEASEEAETMVAVFGVGVVKTLQELEFTNAGFVPVRRGKCQ